MGKRAAFHALVVCLIPLGALVAGDVRVAGTFGLSPMVFLFECLFAGLYVSPILLIGWLAIGGKRRESRGREGRRVFGALVFVCLCSALLAEVWCGIDETRFRREVAARGAEFYARPRSWPDRTAGLVYEDGRFYAHD